MADNEVAVAVRHRFPNSRTVFFAAQKDMRVIPNFMVATRETKYREKGRTRKVSRLELAIKRHITAAWTVASAAPQC
jgi:hypothetical protein